jgi:hypothetical protein
VCLWVLVRVRGEPAVEEDSAFGGSSRVLGEHTDDDLDSAFWEQSSNEGGDAGVEAAHGRDGPDPCGEDCT